MFFLAAGVNLLNWNPTEIQLKLKWRKYRQVQTSCCLEILQLMNTLHWQKLWFNRRFNQLCLSCFMWTISYSADLILVLWCCCANLPWLLPTLSCYPLPHDSCLCQWFLQLVLQAPGTGLPPERWWSTPAPILMSLWRDAAGSVEGGRALSYLHRRGGGGGRKSIKAVKCLSVKFVSTYFNLICYSKSESLDILHREGTDESRRQGKCK